MIALLKPTSLGSPPMREKNSLDLLSRDGSLLVLAEHPESLLVALLRVVVVVHVRQNVAKLLRKITGVFIPLEELNLEVETPSVIVDLVDYVENLDTPSKSQKYECQDI